MKQKIFSTLLLFLFISHSNFFIDKVYAVDIIDISAKASIVIEARTGRVIYDKNMDEKLPMASTTKILTTLIALEQENIEEYFVVDSQAIKTEGSSMGLLDGDFVNLKSLSYGMMLPSGNDAANVVAIKISGSIEKFSDKMNEYAKKIGMKSSNFTNPSGLHDENHYSTAYDMAILMKYAMQNTDFVDITSKYKSTIKYGNPPYSRTLTNHNRLLNTYDWIVGGKTGFTTPAGRCLVSIGYKDDTALIVVTLDAKEDWNDHKILYDYGFKKIKPIELLPNIGETSISVVNGDKSEFIVSNPLAINIGIHPDDFQNLKKQTNFKHFYYAPVMKNDIIGEILYTLDENIIVKIPLLAGETIDRLPSVEDEKEENIFNKFFDSIKNLFTNISKIFS